MSDEHVDNADNLDIIMPIYNLIEYNQTLFRHFRKFMAV